MSTPTTEQVFDFDGELARLRLAAAARPKHATFLEELIGHYAGGGDSLDAPIGTPRISYKIETLLDDDAYELHRWRAFGGPVPELRYPPYAEKLDAEAARRKKFTWSRSD